MTEMEKRMLEQKKFLLQMKKEIDYLENQVKYFKIINVKTSAIKKLKISAKFLRRVAPYLLTAGIFGGCFSFFGATPFYNKDEKKVYASKKFEFDNYGNMNYEKQYQDLDESDNIICNYSKWEKNDDETYTRFIKTYSLKNETIEEVKEILNEENLNLQDIYGEPIKTSEETKNKVSIEELEQDLLIKAVIYEKDKSDYIMRQETVGENVALTLAYVWCTTLGELLILSFREKKSKFNYKESINEINEKYQPLDIEEITKKLELQKENYETLTR